MPFKSEAQRRLFHVKAAKGEISEETVHEWEHATKNKKDLPMHVKKSYELGQDAALERFKAAFVMSPEMSRRLATGVVQGGASAAMYGMMAPEGDKGRQAAIGALSDGIGGTIGGMKGMMASMGGNMALQAMTAPKPHYRPAPETQQMERYASLKLSDHADDRLKERIRADFPPDVLHQLRAQAKDLKVAPGRYYMPMHDSVGNTKAYAAFKTVGKKDTLVLATVLNPANKPPPGSSLSHLLKQPSAPKVEVLGKIDASPKQYTIRKDATGRFTCTCRDFKFRRAGDGTNCKHIDAFLEKQKKSKS